MGRKNKAEDAAGPPALLREGRDTAPMRCDGCAKGLAGEVGRTWGVEVAL